MREFDRHSLGAVAFTAGLAALIFLALSAVVDLAVFVMVGAIVGSAGAMVVLFPGSRFFAFALGNYLAVYTCVFAFFLETNFAGAGRLAVMAAYSLPILSFLAGVRWRREDIRRLVETEAHRRVRRLGPVLRWLLPVFAIGAATFALPIVDAGPLAQDLTLVGSMASIAVIVLFVAREVAAFLLDTGLLFEEFFERISALLVPAFSFLAFYALIVIVFAAVYRIVDQYVPGTHFIVFGEATRLSFSDSLYFSIVTLSTVGYGEILPASGLVRVIVGGEIVCGVMLLLFGFSEILSYARERLDRRRHE